MATPLNVWGIYVCHWLRKLNPDNHSLFWCDAYVVVNVAYLAIDLPPRPSALAFYTDVSLALASVVLGFTTLLVVRAELLRHYNEREPIGIYLSVLWTIFFNFLYFQSQLRPIAQYKRDEAAGLAVKPGRILIP